MTNSIVEASQNKAARVAGITCLITIATGLFAAFYVHPKIIAGNDATQTASNIIASERLFRIGIVADLITFAADVVLIAALYVLLKPVNKHLAMLAAFWRLVETSIYCVMLVGSLIALSFLSGADYLKAFETSQLNALARLALSVQSAGNIVGIIFLGLGSTIFSYLFFKSGYIPRLLAGWGIFASLLLVTTGIALIVFPSWRGTFSPARFVPMTIYQVILGFWLLLKGARIESSSPQSV